MPIERNPHDTAESIELRKNQEDPIILYLIVRDSLGMGKGKVGAQCGHAVGQVMLNYFESSKIPAHERYESEDIKYNLFKSWLSSSYRKVVLKADDREWEKIKEKLDCFLVKDAGLTEVAPQSETVICLWPMRRSERPQLIKKLQTLK